MKPSDGGPAFPCSVHDQASGMSLRAWLAGQALAGMETRFAEPDGAASDCVALADAVLAELRKEQSNG